MSDKNSGGEADGEPTEKSASSANSTERESSDKVPEYEGQWAALSDGEHLESDGDSDGSSDSSAGNSDGK